MSTETLNNSLDESNKYISNLSKVEKISVIDLNNLSNSDSMKQKITNDSNLKSLVRTHFKEWNEVSLKSYSRYGINMSSLQSRLVELWYNLWNFWPKWDWVDWDFWGNTFVWIINVQKSLWMVATWVADLSLLQFLFPSTFRTLNKTTTGRSINDTDEYLKNSINSYKEWLEIKKLDVINKTKEDLIVLKEDIVDEQNKKSIISESYIDNSEIDTTIETNDIEKDFIKLNEHYSKYNIDSVPVHKQKDVKEMLAVMPDSLEAIICRNAINNPDFSSKKPFLAQDLSTRTAYIYYPDPKEFHTTYAWHWSWGRGIQWVKNWNISNIPWSNSTSLWSKKLKANWGRGNYKYRINVDWLEPIKKRINLNKSAAKYDDPSSFWNSTDNSRLIRIHESNRKYTAWCTWLPNDIAKKFYTSVKKYRWWSQEVFLSLNA